MIANARTALIILDLISDYRYPDAETIIPAARRVARNIAALKSRAARAGVPVIYVNDTRGHWESDQERFVQRCVEASDEAAQIVRTLMPDQNDYFLFKPRHSAFYATSLSELIEQLELTSLILTGLTAHQCVLFTAMDAHVRRYELTIPSDCVASSTAVETRHALFILERSTNARVIPARSIRFPRQRRRTRKVE